MGGTEGGEQKVLRSPPKKNTIKAKGKIIFSPISLWGEVGERNGCWEEVVEITMN